MKCKHEIENLMGTADGILCRRCGSLFKTFDDLKADVGEAPAPDPAPEAPAEKPKRTRKKKEA